MDAVPDPLFHVLRAYATLQPPKSIQKCDISFISAHAFVLDRLLLNPHFVEFPPSEQYQLTFWKWAIDWLESLASEEDEVDERIYTHHVDLMRSTTFKTIGGSRPAASYLTYLWPTEGQLDRPIYPGYASATLLESRTTIEAGTTGLRTWSASLILAQYILSHPELVTGRRVLELGCGVGFLGTVVASIQMSNRAFAASSLWLTDVNEPVLQRCEVNLGLPCNRSHLHPDVNIRPLDWSDAMDPLKAPTLRALLAEAQPDVVLGADLVYEPSIIPLLVNVLAAALTPIGEGHEPTAYIALTVRNEQTLSDFIGQAEQLLAVHEVETLLVASNIFTGTTELGQDAATQSVRILKVMQRE